MYTIQFPSLLPGLVVPKWDKVLDTVKRAAMITSNIAHGIWDVAVSETDVTLIEASRVTLI